MEWLKKNNSESIKISVNTFKDKDLLDIRTYYFDEKADEFKPTKKGISINLSDANELIEKIKNVVG